MKTCRWIPGTALAAVTAWGLAASQGRAATIVKANNTTALNQTGSWVGGVVPGSGDIAKWDSTVSAGNSVLLGASQSWSGIEIANPGGIVTLLAGNTLTLGAAGINMSAATQSMTVRASLLAATHQTWTIGTGRSLTLDNNNEGGTYLFAGYNLTLDGPGTLSLGQGIPNNIGVTTISNGRIATSNRASLTTTNLTIIAPGRFEVSSFGGGLTTITVGTGGLSMTQPSSGAYTPVKWLYGSSTNRRATMNLNGTLTFVGHPDNTDSAWIDVNEPTGTYGDGYITWSGARTFDIGDGGAEIDLAIKLRFVGTGSLVKSGDGTLDLWGVGSNTYSGGTTVSEGTLLVCNTEGSGTGTGSVTVNSGATLGGTGTISGATTVANGGTLAPGRLGAGTLSTAAVTLNGTSVLEVQLGAPWQYDGGNYPSPNDLLKVGGNLTLDGQLAVEALDGLAAGTYTVATYTGTLTNNTLEPTSFPDGFKGTISIDEANMAVNVTLVKSANTSLVLIR